MVICGCCIEDLFRIKITERLHLYCNVGLLAQLGERQTEDQQIRPSEGPQFDPGSAHGFFFFLFFSFSFFLFFFLFFFSF